MRHSVLTGVLIAQSPRPPLQRFFKSIPLKVRRAVLEASVQTLQSSQVVVKKRLEDARKPPTSSSQAVKHPASTRNVPTEAIKGRRQAQTKKGETYSWVTSGSSLCGGFSTMPVYYLWFLYGVLVPAGREFRPFVLCSMQSLAATPEHSPRSSLSFFVATLLRVTSPQLLSWGERERKRGDGRDTSKAISAYHTSSFPILLFSHELIGHRTTAQEPVGSGGGGCGRLATPLSQGSPCMVLVHTSQPRAEGRSTLSALPSSTQDKRLASSWAKSPHLRQAEQDGHLNTSPSTPPPLRREPGTMLVLFSLIQALVSP
ncbi:hypothetical protein V8C35DRAFT_165291 [Trichoderma chlorosporum]